MATLCNYTGVLYFGKRFKFVILCEIPHRNPPPTVIVTSFRPGLVKIRTNLRHCPEGYFWAAKFFCFFGRDLGFGAFFFLKRSIWKKWATEVFVADVSMAVRPAEAVRCRAANKSLVFKSINCLGENGSSGVDSKTHCCRFSAR